MSSNAYFAELRPDPALRRFVQWSGVALAATGIVVVAGLEAPAAARLGGGSVWITIVTVQLRTLRRGWAECTALRVYADGAVAVLGPDGEWRSGELLADGILLRRWGWIRLRAGSGQAFAEPLRGRCHDSREWRRLQVVWRHIGAGERSC